MSQSPISESYALTSVDVALPPMERFEEYLQAKGKRITQPRRILVEHVFSKHEHFDADALIEELAQRDAGPKRVSRPTVYRTLNELVEAGLLRKMDIGGRAVYEHDYGYPDHDHLYCTQCGDLSEFHSEELVRLRDAVAREQGFRVTGHKFIVNGTCLDCQRKSRRQKRKVDLI
ncbi:Fur family transcriptional regulator [Blastopirellula retiformator]|uniref:Ferric uptake regulation protein n=1 Tax=Blastopirellula retiformator TaxID=2527970 RepID=A0A5C5UZY2_9BACT|nr:Fur family transcriptional regulator [Blastopirellula retiformator]TWT31924.1 Ferric uptake regulation protein [Blastopirellula retiformator]